LGGQRHRQFQRPLFAVGEIAGDAFHLPCRQPDLFEKLRASSNSRCSRAYRLPETEAGTGIRRPCTASATLSSAERPRKDIGDLIGARHAGGNALVHGEPGHVAPGKMHAAAIRLQGAGNMVDEGGLAGAIGADQGMHLARLDAEIDLF
jgi:hypothetical protein